MKRISLIQILKLLLLPLLFEFCCGKALLAQVDTEFWFVIPEVTKDHYPTGLDYYLRFASLDEASTVTVSMPQNSDAFPDIVINIPANSTYSIPLKNWINIGGVEQDILENKPMNPSGINPFGLYIYATKPITVYYEVATLNNRDIWALKGKNALGTEFFTPFQTYSDNTNEWAKKLKDDPCYSAIDVVATENNTIITFELAPGIAANYGTNIPGKAYTTTETPKIAAGGTYTVTLHKGQSFSLFPKGQYLFKDGGKNYYEPSRLKAHRLAGTRITSNKPIAVSVKDDSFKHSAGTCSDVAGDQLIPTDIAGWDYVVNRTFLNTNDHVYILAIKDGTQVFNGTTKIADLNSKQQHYVKLSSAYARIHTQDANHPVIVLHIGGFGCEVGAAIVPPIDKCTGSTQVAFSRTSDAPFYLTMMVREGAQNSFLVNGAKRNDIINPSSFTLVPGTKWMVARFGPINKSLLPVGSHLVENKDDLFHLGIVNGNETTGCEYGYFSSFNKVRVDATIGGDIEQEYEICLHDSAQLYSFGGNACKWYRVESDATNEYLTPDFLSDNTSLTPKASPAQPGTFTYRVIVNGYCEVRDSAHVTITVGKLENPKFGVEFEHICANEGEFVFRDSTSDDVAAIFWYAKEDDGNDSDLGLCQFDAFPDASGEVPREYKFAFTNISDTVKTYMVTREVWDASWSCSKRQSLKVRACDIDAAPTRTLENPDGCHPLKVMFKANASGYTSGATYAWDFDNDGTTDSNEPDPSFTFSNFTGAVQTYTPKLTVTTYGGECSTTKYTPSVTVQPYIKANFAIDTNQGCSPFTQLVINNCIGGAANFAWDKDGDGAYDDGTLPDDWIFSGTTVNTPKTVNIGLKISTDNGKCIDTYSQPVVINPTPKTDAQFTILSDANCSPLSIKLEGRVTDASASYYRWEEKVGSGTWVTIGNTEDIDEYVISNYGSTSEIHTFRFTVGNSYGCTTTKTLGNIPVRPFIDAQFLIDTVACAPQLITAQVATYQGAYSYSLNWDDGAALSASTGSPLGTVSHVYENTTSATKIHNVKLTVKNQNGCEVNKTQSISIHPEVTPNFTTDKEVGCAPLDVQFSNAVKYSDGTLLGASASYLWSFGDATSSYDASPVHSFANSTSNEIIYKVTLKSESEHGCIDSVSKNITVRPYVQALFAVDTSAGCSPLNVQFSYDRHSGITLYEFDWNDGTSQNIGSASATGSFSHEFVNESNVPITRNVKLKVHSLYCSDSMVLPITIYPKVIADFVLSSTSGCAPHQVAFTNASHYADVAQTPLVNTTYIWNFGDGNSSIEASPIHTFNNIGTVDSIYSVALNVQSEYGCVSQNVKNVIISPVVKANFAIDSSFGCSPLTVGFKYITHPKITKYIWTWGDGTTQIVTSVSGSVETRNILHSYINTTGTVQTFTAKLEVLTNEGCTDFMEIPITVYPQVKADFLPIDTLSCSPSTVSFQNTSLFAGSLTPLANATYGWDFGDGGSSTQASPVHTFENLTLTDSLLYNVTMVARSEFGCVDTAKAKVYVRPFVRANFTIDTSYGCSPLTITFNYDTHPSIKSYKWKWGNGALSNGSASGTITNLYINRSDTVQVWTAKLIIENGTCIDSMERQITIYPGIAAKLEPIDTVGCSPLEVNFRNKSAFLKSNNPLTNATYTWDFGDGSSSLNSDPVHTFSNLGTTDTTYRVKLYAQSQYGCLSVDSTVVTVHPFVEAMFAIDSSSGCSPLSILFNYTTHPSIALYSWDWGDGTSEIITTPTGKIRHSYVNQTGTVKIFKAKLTIDNGMGCTHFMEMPITVYPEITARFAMPDSSDCNPFTVTFNNRSINKLSGTALTATDASYLWTFGDGSTSTDFEPTHTFVNTNGIDTVYNVELLVVSNFGCVDRDTVAVIVYPAIDAQMAIDTSFGCSPLTIGISYTVHDGISSYFFDWNGDGTAIDTIQGVAATGHIYHTYNNQTGTSITYAPKFTVENANGCNKSMSLSVTVAPDVTANFQMADSSDCAPFTVHFSNTTTFTGDGTELVSTDASYLWTFGDGGTSTEFEPIHTFQNTTGADAVYSVRLDVTTTSGCTSSRTIPVTVRPFIEAQMAIDTSFGCSPLTIGFNYRVYDGISSYFFDWNGDGTAIDTITSGATGQIEHTYYNQTGAILNPKPKLTVENVNGCSTFIELPIMVYPEITAAFVTSADSGCNQLEVDITNTSVFTGTSNPITNARYYWVYGDGGSSSAVSPNHIYTNDDTENDIIYTTRLLAISQYGCSDSVTHNIKVFNRVESHFSFEYASHCTPFEVTFTPASLGATTYVWNYGGATNLANDTLYNGDVFSREFTNTHPSDIAHYNVTLEVANAEGCSSTETRVVEVYPIVVANITPSVQAGCSNLEITFDNTSTGGSLVSMWNFGNGQSASNSDKSSVTHTFTNRGSTDSVYTVSLSVINPNGCRDSITTDITVYPKVESSFVFAQESKCTPFYLELTNTSLNGNTFSWDFGYSNLDTVVYSQQSFPYIFDNFTSNDILTYTITLIASDSITGCNAISTKEIEVYPRVVTNFDVDVIEGCNPLIVNFSNTSTGLGSYLWELGDASTSVEHTPAVHTYSHAYIDRSVEYPVRLTTTNIFGCSSHKDTVITVYPLIKSNFRWDKVEGCTPLTVNLRNLSVSDKYSYLWDFGDGTDTTIAQPISHTYVNATNNMPVVESHLISLKVSYQENGITCTDTMTRNINVFPHIYPDFTAEFAGCHPHYESFTNTTLAFDQNNVYEWDFGNSFYSVEQNPELTYYNSSRTEDSIFTVKLISTSRHGCIDSVTHDVTVHPRPYVAMELVSDYISCPQFDVEIENRSVGTNLTNHFIFGDGTDSVTTSMANMKHRYFNSESETLPYIIQLNSVTEFGCDDSVVQTVYVYPEVTANYTVDPSYDGCSPHTVSFDCSSSVNSKFYLWNFGDGVTSSYTQPTHLFVNLGEDDKIFNVTLRASSEFECFDIDTQQIVVYATPIVNFAVEPPLKQYPDATFNIYNQSSPAADSWTYSWNFGDSQYSNLKHPGSHTYLSWAPKDNEYKYDITLMIESPHCSDTLTSTIFLLPAAPIAEFYSEIDSSCSPLEVNFINISEYGESYFWEFGDGTTSTEMEPTHIFETPGYYNVKLTVSGDGGSRFFYRTFRVYQNPKANFVVSPSRVMLPDATIHAFNLSEDYSRSLWDFGDGDISTDQDPLHTYTKIGEYKISLWVYKDYGNDVCTDSISKSPAAWIEGKGVIKFPNAFKPSLDGPNGGVYDAVDYKNQVFHPYHYGVTDYKLIIFNRWGEQIFESTDVNVGWDGYVNGRIADQAVYVWRAVGRFTNDQPFDQKGTVTLIR